MSKNIILILSAMFMSFGCANAKWINPSNKNCLNHGGNIPYGICESNWNNAKKICASMNARLPTIDELKEVITSCGGIIDNTKNSQNLSYQNCYSDLGFESSFYYWSDTKIDKEFVYFVNFNNGMINNTNKISNHFYIRCLK